MYKFSNPNPMGLRTNDCVIRALSILLDQSWDKTFTDISLVAFAKGLMPSSNAVHMQYLDQHGYKMYTIPNTCPQCITVREFSERYPKGKYLLATGDHVVALINGTYYDSFDSGDEIISYYFTQKGDRN